MRTDIDPEKYYSPSELMRENTFPWIKSIMTLMRILKSQEGEILFKPIIQHLGKNKRYYIKGGNIIEVLQRAERGDLHI